MQAPEPGAQRDEGAYDPPLSEQAILFAFLSEQDVSCPLCGYNLRGLRSPRCPECGRGVKLTVGISEPYLRAWVTLLVTTCASAGIGILLGLVLLFEKSSDGLSFTNVVMFGFVVTIPFAALVVAIRRTFVRHPKSAQWSIAGAALAMLIGGLVLFMMSIH